MATHEMDVEEARAQIEELIERVRRGEEVIIKEGGVVLVRLIAATDESRRPFGSARGQIEVADDFDDELEDLAEYTR